jgi:hypothetical protein
MLVPGIGVKIYRTLKILAEYVDWERDAPGAHSTVDRSVNVTVHGSFSATVWEHKE